MVQVCLVVVELWYCGILDKGLLSRWLRFWQHKQRISPKTCSGENRHSKKILSGNKNISHSPQINCSIFNPMCTPLVTTSPPMLIVILTLDDNFHVLKPTFSAFAIVRLLGTLPKMPWLTTPFFVRKNKIRLTSVTINTLTRPLIMMWWAHFSGVKYSCDIKHKKNYQEL